MNKKEKALALASLVKSQVSQVGGEVISKLAGGKGGVSREFYLLLKSIGDVKSKQEEDQIILKEVNTLKKLLSNSPPKEKMKEYVLRLLYCEMLGHDVEFGYVHALTLTQSSNIIEKKIGYVAVSAFLHKDHPLVIMTTSSFHRDLESDNYLVICAALSTMSKILIPETVPTVVSMVTKLLDHSKEQVRQGAISVLHSCWRIKGTSLNQVMDKVRKALCDKSPCVMIASLNMFDDMITEYGRDRYMDLISSFVSVLKQIIENRLPQSYNYHQIPAPWAQIQLLEILRKLAKNDEKASLHIYEVLKQTMKKSDMGISIGFSIVYECIRTITEIYPNDELLEQSVVRISRFIKNDNKNVKCIGVSALSEIVKINPNFANGYQLDLMDCLEDSDDTLQLKTLDLLYIITNSRNVVSITEKMIKILKSSTDNIVKKRLIDRIAHNAERYAPNFPWYIETMKAIFIIGKDLVDSSIAHNLCEVLLQGTGESSIKDNQLRNHALKVFYNAIQEPTCTLLLLQVTFWLLGEFVHLSNTISITDAIVEISSRLEDPLLIGECKVTAVFALNKLLAREPSLIEDVSPILHEQKNSKSIIAQQAIYESIFLLQDIDLLKLGLIDPSQYETIDIDSELNFANNYVQEALELGALPYQTAKERALTEFSLTKDVDKNNEDSLKWQEYPEPKSEIDHYIPNSSSSSDTLVNNTSTINISSLQDIGQKKSVWSSEGYSGVIQNTNNPRPIYSNFPIKSKYSTTKLNNATTTKQKDEINKDPIKKKQVEQQKRREKEAAALLGLDNTSIGYNPTPITKQNQKQKQNHKPTKVDQLLDLKESPKVNNPIKEEPLPLSNFITSLISKSRISHPPKFLVGDSKIILSQFKIWENNNILKLVLIFNAISSTLSNIKGSIQIPNNINISYSTDGSIEISNNNEFNIPSLEKQSPICIICECLLKSFEINMNTIIRFSYDKMKQIEPIQALQDLYIFDFIEPAKQMNIQSYSKEWKLAKEIFKIQIKLQFPTIKSVEEYITNNINCQVIQTIKNEIISGALYKNEYLLIHCKIFINSHIQLQIKGNKQLCQLFLRHIQKYTSK